MLNMNINNDNECEYEHKFCILLPSKPSKYFYSHSKP